MNHKELEVWKRGMDLAVEIYDFSKKFPSSEIYGLTAQLRRSGISIPSNIAEGAARKGDKEFLQFLNISLGSLSELETQYQIALRLRYAEESKIIEQLIIQVRKLIVGTRNYLLRKQ